jgi:hypothetical protein
MATATPIMRHIFSRAPVALCQGIEVSELP